MNAFGYIKICNEKNSKKFYLDIPVGATWQDCIDATLEFIPQIQSLRDNAAQLEKQQDQSPQEAV